MFIIHNLDVERQNNYASEFILSTIDYVEIEFTLHLLWILICSYL